MLDLVIAYGVYFSVIIYFDMIVPSITTSARLQDFLNILHDVNRFRDNESNWDCNYVLNCVATQSAVFKYGEYEIRINKGEKMSDIIEKMEELCDKLIKYLKIQEGYFFHNNVVSNLCKIKAAYREERQCIEMYDEPYRKNKAGSNNSKI